MAADLLKRLKPLLDAGIDLAQMSPSRAEALVRELVRRGEVRRKEADALLSLLVVRGKGATGQAAEVARVELNKLVNSQVAKQIERMIERVAQLEHTVEALTALVPRPGRGTRPNPSPADVPAPASPARAKSSSASVAPTAAQSTKTAGKKTAGKKASSKTTGTKKTASKTTGAKKAAATKPAAKKPAAKTTPTTKAGPSAPGTPHTS